MKNHILLSIFLVIAISCHKEESQSIPEYYVDSTVTSQEFYIGSYWIFENDSTHKTDCTYVSNVHTGYYEYCPGHALCSNTHYYDIFYLYSYSLNGTPNDRERIENSWVMRDPVPIVGNIMRGPLMFDGKSSNFFTLEVGNNIFYQVQKATVDSTDYYTAKSIGLVKKVVHDSIDKGTWNLLRWKVIK